MHIERLAVREFRNYDHAELEPASEGVTVLEGPNGSGKTNLLEAAVYLSVLRSFRGATPPLLVKVGQGQSFLRARAWRQGRLLELESEILSSGRGRLRRNGQIVRRSEDFVGQLLTTVFSPDDIGMVKGGPQGRRDFLDSMLAALSAKHVATMSELERGLRQRNALLRAAGGALRPGMEKLLDVWDAKVAEAGEMLVEARESLVASLEPEVERSYAALGGQEGVHLRYERSWDGELLRALVECRQDDVRRGVTGAGPQRDDLQLLLGGLAARSQASQGQQRSLALAMRLGGHALVTARQGSSPVLLLDDVFSELDPARSAALAACLPAGQALLTTAGPVPRGLEVAKAFSVSAGAVAGPGHLLAQ